MKLIGMGDSYDQVSKTLKENYPGPEMVFSKNTIKVAGLILSFKNDKLFFLQRAK